MTGGKRSTDSFLFPAVPTRRLKFRYAMPRIAPPWVLPIVLMTVLVGCGRRGPVLVPVTGTLKYPDGTIPEGEVRTVRFEPVISKEGPNSMRPATANLQADGGFKLMTFKPGDGALEGDYKPVVLIWKVYRQHDSVIPDTYTKSGTTPLPVMKVRAGQKNHFDLVVDKRPAR